MTAPTPDLAAIKRRLSNANGLGLDEVVARHYREDVPALLAHVEQQAAEIEWLRDKHRDKHRDLVSRLGFGDNITEPMADNDTVVAWFEEQGREAAEWRESQRWRCECAAAGHPDDEDCYEHDPALRLEAAEAREAALVAKVAALAEECGSSGCIHLNDLWGRLRTLLAEHATPSDEACLCDDINYGVDLWCAVHPNPVATPGDPSQGEECEDGVFSMPVGMPVIIPLPSDPPQGEAVARCPECRHAPHGSVGFCPNMASDNDCACTYRDPAPASVETGLSEDEREALYAAFAGWSTMPNDLPAVVERILSDRLAAVERERALIAESDAHWRGKYGALRAVVAKVEGLLREAERRTATGLGTDFNGNRWESPIPLADLRAALATTPVQAGTGAQDGEGDRS